MHRHGVRGWRAREAGGGQAEYVALMRKLDFDADVKTVSRFGTIRARQCHVLEPSDARRLGETAAAFHRHVVLSLSYFFS